MNKINSIYTTEVVQIQQNPIKPTYVRFTAKLDQHIKQAIAYKKHEIIKESGQMMDQIRRIKEQSGKYKHKIYENQQQFQQQVQTLIRYDIHKWEDYQSFFKNHFERLELQIKELKFRNNQYKEQVKMKMQQLKSYNREHTTLSLLSHRKNDNLTTKESSIRLSYSDTGNKRIKTDASLPVLKQVNRFERIKTLQSEYEGDEEQKQQKSPKRYMQKIGTIKEMEASSLPLLLELLEWYKNEQATQTHWFLKILYNARHYKKLKTYLKTHSISRRVTRIKS